jgi:hypothetical protein
MAQAPSSIAIHPTAAVFFPFTCFSLLHLYIPNTGDTISLASANDNYGKLVKGTIL